MKEISKFYKSLVQEVVIRQRANEEGDSQEQTFTRYCMELLSEAGETENYDIAFLERGLGTKNQLKIKYKYRKESLPMILSKRPYTPYSDNSTLLLTVPLTRIPEK